MTDMDRLREAADVLDDFANQDRMHGSHASAVQDAAIAGLLRAVADDEAWFAVNLTWQHPTWTAAVALADSILAVSDD